MSSTLGSVDLLGGRVGPVIQEKLALGLIVMLSLVASRTEGNSVNQGTTRDEIKDLPDELAREELVTREGLALGSISSRPLGLCVFKVKGVDVAQLQISEVGEHGISKLRCLLNERVPRGGCYGLGPSRGDIRLVSSYVMFQISDGSSRGCVSLICTYGQPRRRH